MCFLKYKKFVAIVLFNKLDQSYFGRFYNLKDYVTFEAANLSEAIEEFKNAVNDYLEFCEEIDKIPEFLDLNHINERFYNISIEEEELVNG